MWIRSTSGCGPARCGTAPTALLIHIKPLEPRQSMSYFHDRHLVLAAGSRNGPTPLSHARLSLFKGRSPGGTVGSRLQDPRAARRSTCVRGSRDTLLHRGFPGRRMGPPKSSGGRTAAPHSSHSTRNADGKRAPHEGHRCRTSAAQVGHSAGSSVSSSTKYRRVKPQSTQNATQSPSVLRRSSWIQFLLGRSRAPMERA
jgi:hypothetical protein